MNKTNVLDMHRKIQKKQNKEAVKNFDCRISLFLQQINTKYSDENYQKSTTNKEMQVEMIKDIDNYITMLIKSKSCSKEFSQDLQLWLRSALQIGE